MTTGWIASLIVAGVMIVLILAIVIPFDRKYIVRDARRKIDFQQTKVFFRWNVFDTLSLILAAYAVICVQVLNFLVMGGHTITNNYVQFFTNQAQAWTLVAILYLVSRISLILKGLKELQKHGAV
ncbi:hypothetical protein [Ectobacillus ponti]|uniref:Group-specific protein n=1 Tax=Ectobacillus ponti TaxID=2961894 RepID=A0AA42BNM5_9BACI|nr:hypothetical protein [Ectobacillus ponti]MCP8968140.1 hypothetical protein [Ectobacillus ponti]